MKRFWSTSIFLLMILSGLSFAKEPVNLAVVKESLVKYHDNGQYERDMNKVVNRAVQYLSYRLSQHRAVQPAIVLDIDETALSNYPTMLKLGFGGTLDEIHAAEDRGQDLPILPTLKLYRFAKAHQIAVFFISGRPESERDSTERNLKNAGYNGWDGLTLRTDQYQTTTASTYKTAIRKQLIEKGYDVWLNLGDQESDLVGSFADKPLNYLIPIILFLNQFLKLSMPRAAFKAVNGVLLPLQKGGWEGFVNDFKQCLKLNFKSLLTSL